jgi:hypothetical protein
MYLKSYGQAILETHSETYQNRNESVIIKHHTPTSLLHLLLLLLLLLLICWPWVRLSPVRASATICPIVPAPDDWWWWVWSSRWYEWQGKPKYSEKTCPSATLSTTNPTWPDPCSHPDSAVGSRRLTVWAMTRPYAPTPPAVFSVF